jgi:hypothetical protein
MTHPRLSINALSSYKWTFDEDLALWRELGVRWAGLIGAKCGDDLDGGLARMADAGIRASTVIAAGFNLGKPETWDDARAALIATLDTVAKYHGWSVYITPGRTTFAPWSEVLEMFHEASAPCVGHAGMCGVRLAFEPSARPDVSFINTSSTSAIAGWSATSARP